MSETIYVIGDVHGKTQSYQKILRQKYEGKQTVQVGDMGIGFPGVGLHKMPENHVWFRGNHDNPEKCRNTTNYLGDWGVLRASPSVFFLAGAFSIDRAWRVEGESWWYDEELSYQQLQEAIGVYSDLKPKYVLTHEAPARAGRAMLDTLNGPYFSAKGDCCMSRTAEALQQMFEIHQPKEWVFGHYHVDRSFQIEGIKFTCVAELSQYELVLE